MDMPFAGMRMFGKLLPGLPFRFVVSGVPSCPNKSMRTVKGTPVAFEITISDDQLPPAANCGRISAFGPPMFAATCGTAAGIERLVIGTVLKFVPEKRS